MTALLTLRARRVRLPAGPRRVLGRLAELMSDRLPPTVLGWAVAIVCLGALWRWGYGALDLLVFVVAVAGLALFVLSSLVVGGTAVWLSRRVRHMEDSSRRITLEADSATDTGYSLPDPSRVPLVQLRWSWLGLPVAIEPVPGDDGRLHEIARPRRRMLVDPANSTAHPAITRRLVVSGAFGLSRVAWQRPASLRVRVLPAVGALRSMPALPSFSAGDSLPHPTGEPEGDRMEIRRYVPGDSVRHILWKTYARTRQLNVRVPERAIDRATRTVAYLLAGRDDEAAAAAARVSLERGLLGPRWLFAADGGGVPTEELEPALDAVAASGAFERVGDGSPADGLRAFLARPEVRSESHCLVFATARVDDGDRWIDDALAAAAGFGGRVSFVLATDGVAPPRAGDDAARRWRDLGRRLLFDLERDVSLDADALRGLFATFQRAGVGVLIVDRTTGRTYGQLGGVGAPALRKAG